MNFKAFTFLVLLFFVGNVLKAQSASFVVQLKENFEVPKEQYFYGGYIEIRIGEDWIVGSITKADSFSLTIRKERIPIDEIEAVRIRSNTLNLFGSALQAGGTLYLGVVSANSLINDERPVLRNGELIGGTAAVGMGFLLKRLSYKDIELKNGWRLNVILFEP